MDNKILEEINIQDYNIITAVRKVKENESFPIHYKKTKRVKCITNTLPFILQVEEKNYLINDKDFLLLKDENNNVVLSTYKNENIESDFFNEYKGPIYDTFKNADIKFQTKKIYCKALDFAINKYNLIKLEGLDKLPDINELFNDNKIKFPYKKIIYTAVLSYIKQKTNENPNINSHIEYLNDAILLFKRNKKLIDVLKKNEIHDIKRKLALLENNKVVEVENNKVVEVENNKVIKAIEVIENINNVNNEIIEAIKNINNKNNENVEFVENIDAV